MGSGPQGSHLLMGSVLTLWAWVLGHGISPQRSWGWHWGLHDQGWSRKGRGGDRRPEVAWTVSGQGAGPRLGCLPAGGAALVSPPYSSAQASREGGQGRGGPKATSAPTPTLTSPGALAVVRPPGRLRGWRPSQIQAPAPPHSQLHVTDPRLSSPTGRWCSEVRPERPEWDSGKARQGTEPGGVCV